MRMSRGVRAGVRAGVISWIVGLATASAVVATAPTEGAQGDTRRVEFPAAPSELLILGSFHFDDKGLDEYKPKHRLDVGAAARQREITTILDRLVEFGPTRIAVEVRADQQERLDASYSSYLEGEKELTANEIHQIAFRLGRRLGHERLWAVDAPTRSYTPAVNPSQWAMANGQGVALLRGGWDRHFKALYERDDAAKLETSLVDHLLYLNDPERLRIGHGHYLIGAMAVGDGSEYPGADAMTAWFNRNLRIFSNLLRLSEPGDRVLLLIGAGHVPIIRHTVDASPDFRLIEVADVLAASTGGDDSGEP